MVVLVVIWLVCVVGKVVVKRSDCGGGGIFVDGG